MINIRSAKKDDVEILQKLDQEVFISDLKHDPDLDMNWALGEKGQRYFSGLLNDLNAYCLIAEENNLPIGYIVAGPRHVDYRLSKSAEIYNMGVSPTYRSKGIGSELIFNCLKWAKDKGYKKLFVSAYFKNEKAVKFYKRNGFEEIDLGLEQDL